MPNDHYVPQFLLRGFSIRPTSRPQIWYLSKPTGRIARGRVSDYACEPDWYLDSHDDALRERENETAPIIARIRNERDIRGLAASDQRQLAEFVAEQFYRTKVARSAIQTLLATDPVVQQYYAQNQPTTEYPLKRAHADTMHLVGPTAHHLLRGKSWLLSTCSSGTAFVIGDQPVLMRFKGPMNTSAKALSDAIFEMAISPELLLGFWPPQSVDDGSILTRSGLCVAHYPLNDLARVDVDRFNRQQVEKAQEYVFAATREALVSLSQNHAEDAARHNGSQ